MEDYTHTETVRRVLRIVIGVLWFAVLAIAAYMIGNS
jgi:succinate dehydrogenase hydrophobic anchor subunit